MNGWKTIESAPKDGTAILAWDGVTQTTIEWNALGGYWSLCACGARAEDSEWIPTHWKSLEPSPRSTGAEP